MKFIFDKNKNQTINDNFDKILLLSILKILYSNLSKNTHLSEKTVKIGLKKMLMSNRLNKMMNYFTKEKEEISQKTINKLFDFFKLSEPVAWQKGSPEFIVDIMVKNSIKKNPVFESH